MYNPKRLQWRFATDTFYAGMKYFHGNIFCQVYSHKLGFSACYPNLNVKGGSIVETLDEFVHEFGVPEHLTFYIFQSQVGKNTKFNKNLCRYMIGRHIYAPRQPNENPA